VSVAIAVSEAQFQKQVTDLAELNGWQWLHVVRMGNARGEWRTPTTGPLGKGWPDLFMVKGSQIIFVELKGSRGLLTPHQSQVLYDSLAHFRTYVWRPGDWAQIMDVLCA
jgi:hypothetical protein